jgi:hypothetical protein
MLGIRCAEDDRSNWARGIPSIITCGFLERFCLFSLSKVVSFGSEVFAAFGRSREYKGNF